MIYVSSEVVTYLYPFKWVYTSPPLCLFSFSTSSLISFLLIPKTFSLLWSSHQAFYIPLHTLLPLTPSPLICPIWVTWGRFLLSNFYHHLSEFLYHVDNIFSTLFPIPWSQCQWPSSLIHINNSHLQQHIAIMGLFHTWNLKLHSPFLGWHLPCVLPSLSPQQCLPLMLLNYSVFWLLSAPA